MESRDFKIVFFDPFMHFYDRHGVYALSAVLKKNHATVDFVHESRPQKAVRKIAALKPDLLLYSSFSSSVPAFIRFDQWVKQAAPIKSAIGGPGPTFDWQSINHSTIDAICVGEGETALIEFIHSGFQTAGNIFLRGENGPSQFWPQTELDRLPFPDRELIYQTDATLRNSPSKQFLSGRGCPYRCTYCFNHKYNEIFKACGPVIRKKSVSYLLEEIRSVRSQYPLTNVVFNDDTFILDKKWLFEFCERFPREIGLTYTCNIRANLMDEEIAKVLSESRCVAVNWSIESGNDTLRNEVLKRGMSKDQILNAAGYLRKYRIAFRIGNIIGLPGENFDQMMETVELNIQAKPNLGLANIFVPFPGLDLSDYAIRHGYYTPASPEGLPHDFFTRSALNISSQENIKIQKLLYLFPFLVSRPELVHPSSLRRMLFGLPRWLLRIIYEIFYAYKMMRLYEVKTTLRQKCRMAARYLASLKKIDWSTQRHGSVSVRQGV